jgi:uncharacterized membrane protein required for colicin V production
VTITGFPQPPVSFTWFDLAVAIVLVLFAWRGYRRGALRWMASLAALILSLLGAYLLAPHLTSLVAGHSTFGRLIAERITFVVVLVVLRVVVGWAMQELVSSVRPLLRALPPLDLLDHLLGVIPSLAIGAVLVLLALAVAILLPIDQRIHSAAASSYTAQLVSVQASHALRRLPSGGLPLTQDELIGIERGFSPQAFGLGTIR